MAFDYLSTFCLFIIKQEIVKKIIISESQETLFLNAILDESLSNGDESNKVLMISKFLDQNFSRADTNVFDSNGYPVNKQVVAWLTPNKEPAKLLRSDQLFYVLQDKFQNIIADKNERDDFLKKVIKAWYAHKITKDGSILN